MKRAVKLKWTLPFISFLCLWIRLCTILPGISKTNHTTDGNSPRPGLLETYNRKFSTETYTTGGRCYSVLSKLSSEVASTVEYD